MTRAVQYRSCPLDLNLKIEVAGAPDDATISVVAWGSDGTTVLAGWPLTAEEFAVMWDDYTRASWRQYVCERINWSILFLPTPMTRVLGVDLVAGTLEPGEAQQKGDEPA